MKKYRLPALLLYFLVVICTLQTVAFSQYWFQSGVKTSYTSSQNNGAGVYIQTIEPQNATYGSFGFWIGEPLKNGAFIQVGYEVPNATGYYPSNCSPLGCNSTVYLKAGDATWFWEYFPANYTGNKFYGDVGDNNSVGQNGTFNRYSFESNGSVWSFYLNNNTIGSINLGVSSSGSGSPSAFGELADTNVNDIFMRPVYFKNMYILNGKNLDIVQDAFIYRGYGQGSRTNISNPYGVESVAGLGDYFEVGSGIKLLPNNTNLWNNIYFLNITSEYGNVIGNGYYKALSVVNFSVPKYVYISPTERAVFEGWMGSNAGSYTGPLNFAQATMDTNISEKAEWKLQYFVSINSGYGNVSGGGWYYPNETADISLNSGLFNLTRGIRYKFLGWNDGNQNLSFKIAVNGPVNISAFWQKQYLVNLTSQYGEVAGGGWYNAGSTANISINPIYLNETNSSRLSFYSWSNLYNSSKVSFLVDLPINLNAIYKRQYLTHIIIEDDYGNPINESYISLDNLRVNGSVFLFSGVPYTINYIYYKNTLIPINYQFNVSNPKNIYVKATVYNILIKAESLFKKRLNATILISFSNGTSISTSLGNNGTVLFRDVPFGSAQGYAYYYGIRERVDTIDGTDVNLIFITIQDLILIIFVIIFMFVALIIEKIYTKSKSKIHRK